MPTTIRNETPCHLEITGAEGQKLFLSPLEVRQLDKDELTGFDLSTAKRAGLIYQRTEPPSETVEQTIGIGCGFAFLIGIVCTALAAIKQPPFWAGSWKEFIWTTGGVVWLLVTVGVALNQTKSWRVVSTFIAQFISLLFILAIGLGLPALTIYFFGEGNTLLAQSSPGLFARLLQLSFIATASLLPVLLFFLFDRYQLSTMRTRLYRDLFRLDQSLRKRSEIDVKYGAQIREAYGPEEQTRGRLARGTRSPVLVCAFVMTMGWIAAFKPVGPVDPSLLTRSLFPEHTALTFGFLGAYFFGLQLISRRYARGDLKPKAYSYVTTRILIVAVLSWALELIYTADSKFILIGAFLIGIVPEEFFTFLKENLRGRGPARLVPESEKHPLTRLEGIDLYDRARLEQEGIVNVESLAHYDLIQLVLETQIPVPRLVDWMDQAILYLHVVEEQTASTKTTGQRLREYGIRTATDLLACWAAAKRRGELSEFKRLLGSNGKIHRLELIYDALLDDEWLSRVLDWRRDPMPEPLEVDAVPNTFESKLRWALDLEKAGRPGKAMDILHEVLAFRDDATVRAHMAQLYADGPEGLPKDIAASREHTRRAAELGAENYEVMNDLVQVHETNGDVQDAIVAAERAIELIGDPGQDDEKKTMLKSLREKRAALQSQGASQVVTRET